MVLPLLAGLAGSALAGANVLGSMSPLVASAIGSGIGAFAETGDPMDALTAGATSALTGGLLGGTMANAAGNLAGSMGAQAAGQAAGQAAAQGAGQMAGQGAAQAAMGSQLAPAASFRPMARGTGEAAAALAAKEGGKGFMGGLFSGDMMGQIGGESGLLGAPAIKGYVGALGAQAGMPLGPVGPALDDADKEKYRESRAPGRSLRRPTGLADREFDYQVQPNYGVGRMQDGGIATLQEPAGDTDNRQIGGRNAKQVVSDAIAAIEGVHPAPEMALGAFLAMYGQDKLRALIKDVTSGQARERRAQQAGLIRGPEGAGDLVPANIDGQQDVLLEDGEFVMNRPAVENMGGGDVERGGQRLAQMMELLERKPVDGKQAREMMPT